MMALGRKSKTCLHGFGDFVVADFAGAKGVDVNRQRLRFADGISDLRFAAVGQAGRDDVFGDVAHHVAGAAIHFCRIFARKRAAAVTAHAAVGVHDDFATGQAGVALRAADDETARRVDEDFDFVIPPYRPKSA